MIYGWSPTIFRELTSFKYEEEGAVSERLRREVARGFQDVLLSNAGSAQNVQETGKAFIVAAAKIVMN